MVMAIHSFRDLAVWQRSVDLSVAVYRITRSYPKSETYGLSSQTQRAAVSIPANIAEGHGRESTKEFLHHLSYSLGSLAEIVTHLLIAQRLNYVDNNRVEPLLNKCQEIGKMLRGLQKSLKAKL